jgi:hypothetical protein
MPFLLQQTIAKVSNDDGGSQQYFSMKKASLTVYQD